jgi:hypothetical protein
MIWGLKMKKSISVFAATFVLAFAGSAFAGSLTVHNKTDGEISVECGENGSAHIHGGDDKTIDIHHKGEVQCTARDQQGNLLGERSFDFHHLETTYSWEVSHDH